MSISTTHGLIVTVHSRDIVREPEIAWFENYKEAFDAMKKGLDHWLSNFNSENHEIHDMKAYMKTSDHRYEIQWKIVKIPKN
jgi:hypothetical protein